MAETASRENNFRCRRRAPRIRYEAFKTLVGLFLHTLVLLVFLWVSTWASTSASAQNRSTSDETIPGANITDPSAAPDGLSIPGSLLESRSEGLDSAEGLGEPPLGYRRWYVPSDRIVDLPWGDDHYLPIDAEELEEMLQILGESHIGSSESWEVGFTSAVYEATLEADVLTDGSARLEVRHNASHDSRLEIGPCSLAVREAKWADRDGEEASLGWNSTARCELEVSQSGRLEFDWSMQGRRESGGPLTFDLQLPRAPSNTFYLTLPSDMTPILDHGLVLDNSPTGDGQHRWRLELGGRYENVLRISRPDGEERLSSQRPRVSQSVTYEASLSGVEVTTLIQFNAYDSLPYQIGIDISSDLRLTSSTFDGEAILGTADPVSYSDTSLNDVESDTEGDPEDDAESDAEDDAQADAEGDVNADAEDDDQIEPLTHYIFALPQGGPKKSRGLIIKAFAPVTLDKKWELPALRVDENDVQWIETRSVLTVLKPLMIEEIFRDRVRQLPSGVLGLTRTGDGESASFQYFDSDAILSVRLTHAEPVIRCDGGTNMQFDGGEIIANTQIVLTTIEGELFDLRWKLAPGWTVESLETEPKNALAYWSLMEESDGERDLLIRLREAATPSREIRFLATTHRSYSTEEAPLESLAWTPLAFDQDASGRTLVALRVGDGYQLSLLGEDAQRAQNASTVSPSDAALFSAAPVDILFDDVASLHDLAVDIEEVTPDYAVDVQVLYTASRDALIEESVFRCTPKKGRVEYVLVELPHCEGAPPTWSLANEDEPSCEAELLPPNTNRSPRNTRNESESGTDTGDGNATDDATNDATDDATDDENQIDRWRIRLSPPRLGSFELKATRLLPFDGSTSIGTPRLPEAEEVSGAVRIATLGRTNIIIEDTTLRAIPIPFGTNGAGTTVRAAFRYDAPVSANEAPTIRLARQEDEPDIHWAWVWNYRLDSHWEANGRTRHQITYWLENRGRRSLTIRLPERIDPKDVHGIWVDGEASSWRSIEENDLALEVRLPLGLRYPTICIHFSENTNAFTDANRPSPPHCEIDAPVFESSWGVWLPPSHTAQSNVDWRLSPSWSSTEEIRYEMTHVNTEFGCLGLSQGEIFDPVSRNDWFQLFGRNIRQEESRERAESLLDNLTMLASSRPFEAEDLNSDWSTLLTDPTIADVMNNASDGGRPLPLLIDREGLSRIGIAPSSPLRFVSSNGGYGQDDLSSRGDTFLQEGGLAVLIHEDAVVLTSRVEAARLREELSMLSDSQVLSVQPGRLSDTIAIAVAGNSRSLIEPEAWSLAGENYSTPWDSALRTHSHESADLWGWGTHEISLDQEAFSVSENESESRGLTLALTNRDLSRSLCWSAFLVVASLTSIRKLRPGLILFILGVLLTILPFLSTLAYESLMGAFFGGICGLAIQMLGIRTPRVPRVIAIRELPKPHLPLGDAPALRVLLIAVVGVAALSILLAAAHVFAQSDQDDVPTSSEGDASASRASEINVEDASDRVMGLTDLSGMDADLSSRPDMFHPIIIPVDEEDELEGDKYYVSEEFYEELLRRVREQTSLRRGWQIRAASYHGTLGRDALSENVELEHFSATFDLQILGDSADVRIPLVDALPSDFILNGRPVEPFRRERDGTLVFRILEKGPCRLQMTLLPKLDLEVGRGSFAIGVPPAPESILILDAPSEFSEMEFPTALGETQRIGESQFLVDLGQVDSIIVRWAEDTALRSNGPLVECDELSWLHLGAGGSVVLQIRFRYRISEGSIDEVRLTKPVNMRLRGNVSCSTVGVETPTTIRDAETSPEVEVLRIPLSESVTDALELTARFELEDFPGVGRLTVPHIFSTDVSEARRRMAVSAASTLRPPESSDLNTVAATEFLAVWGESDETALFVVQNEDGRPWEVDVRPLAASPIAQQNLDVLFGRDECRIRFQGLATSSDVRFSERIRVPASATIDHVDIVQDDAGLVYRWSRPRPDLIVVFLRQPLSGDYRIELTARTPAQLPSDAQVPIISLEGVDSTDYQLRLYRLFDVLVSVPESSSEFAASEQAFTETAEAIWSREGRPVAAFLVDSPNSFAMDVGLSENNPQVRTQQRTTLQQTESGWSAECRFQIEVEGGLLDECRVEAPIAMTDLRANNGFETTLSKENKLRTLILQPREAISGSYEFTVSSPLQFASGDPVSVPSVSIVDAELKTHLLVLPTESLRLAPLTWETRGLTPTETPDDAVALIARDAFTAYAVENESFEAILSLDSESAEVYALTLHAAWRPSGGAYGVAFFDVQSGGLSECILVMPPGLHPLHASVDGASVVPVLKGDGRRSLLIGWNPLPRRIEIVFEGELSQDEDSSSIHFPTPWLETVDGEALPVHNTFWAIASPSAYQPSHEDSLSDVEYAEARLQHLCDTMETIETLHTVESPEISAWYRSWSTRWSLLSSRTRSQLLEENAIGRRTSESRNGSATTNQDVILAAHLDSLESRQLRLAESLGMTDIWNGGAGASPGGATPSDEVWESLYHGPRVVRGHAENRIRSIELRGAPLETAPIGNKISRAFGVASVMVLILIAWTTGWIASLFRRSPHLVGVALGIIWWALLTPSILGLILVAISLVSLFRPGWGRTRESASSTRSRLEK